MSKDLVRSLPFCLKLSSEVGAVSWNKYFIPWVYICIYRYAFRCRTAILFLVLIFSACLSVF